MFKVGETIRCLQGDPSGLTAGKDYVVTGHWNSILERQDNPHVQITTDFGRAHAGYYNTNFTGIDRVPPIRKPGDILFSAPETLETHDSGANKGSKPVRIDLIPWSARAELGYAFGKGAEKYGENNNRAGMPFSTCLAAAERHILKFESGADFDEETGIHHLAAVMFYCSAIMDYQARNVGTDDRPA